MRITNGWYEWIPNENCNVEWLNVHQVVQVIEGMVWATFVADEVTVRRAKSNGTFTKRFELTKGVNK